jgi:hypothetical protein
VRVSALSSLESLSLLLLKHEVSLAVSLLGGDVDKYKGHATIPFLISSFDDRKVHILEKSCLSLCPYFNVFLNAAILDCRC